MAFGVVPDMSSLAKRAAELAKREGYSVPAGSEVAKYMGSGSGQGQQGGFSSPSLSQIQAAVGNVGFGPGFGSVGGYSPYGSGLGSSLGVGYNPAYGTSPLSSPTHKSVDRILAESRAASEIVDQIFNMVGDRSYSRGTSPKDTPDYIATQNVLERLARSGVDYKQTGGPGVTQKQPNYNTAEQRLALSYAPEVSKPKGIPENAPLQYGKVDFGSLLKSMDKTGLEPVNSPRFSNMKMTASFADPMFASGNELSPPNYGGIGWVPGMPMALSSDTGSPASHVYSSPDQGFISDAQFWLGRGMLNGNPVATDHGKYGWAVDIHPTFPVGSDNAFDTAGRSQIPVVAVNDGIVVFSGDTGSQYGNLVVIQNLYDSSKYEIYSHQSKNAVQVGQPVKEGQIIGNFGATGSSNIDRSGTGGGVHLHYELIRADQFNIDNNNQISFNNATYLSPEEHKDAWEKLSFWYGIQ